jgi:hypothetical protein
VANPLAVVCAHALDDDIRTGATRQRPGD